MIAHLGERERTLQSLIGELDKVYRVRAKTLPLPHPLLPPALKVTNNEQSLRDRAKTPLPEVPLSAVMSILPTWP